MRAAAEFGAWYDVVVGNLELDSFGRNIFQDLAEAFHELYGSERRGVCVVFFVGFVYHCSDGCFEQGRAVP